MSRSEWAIKLRAVSVGLAAFFCTCGGFRLSRSDTGVKNSKNFFGKYEFFR